MEWLRRIIHRILGKKEPKPTVYRRLPLTDRPKPTSQPRHGIRRSDLGMRKLSRHKKGRVYDRQSGFDPDKRMVDIKDDDERPQRRKKRGWAEDRKQ